MTKERVQRTETTEWRGITIAITFEPDWLGMGYTAHLQLEAIRPERAKLPITETGYRSHFLEIGRVEAFGGPVAYALGWLDDAANSKEWKANEAASRQLTLF